jgi:hypothetical protein
MEFLVRVCDSLKRQYGIAIRYVVWRTGKWRDDELASTLYMVNVCWSLPIGTGIGRQTSKIFRFAKITLKMTMRTRVPRVITLFIDTSR